jgi:cingulin-like protein 1
MRQDLEDLTQREICLREELREATESHRRQVDEFVADRSRHIKRLDELQEELDNVAPLTQEFGRVKMALHDATDELLVSKATNQNQSDRIVKLEHELRAANVRVNAIEEQLEYANQRKEETTTQLSNLESAQANEQEILSEELRESETTIACLMEELELLRSIAPELESVELALERSNERCRSLETTMKAVQGQKDAEIRALLSRLEDSDQEIKELRLQLLPLTKELQQASRELEEMQQQLRGNGHGSHDAITDKFRRFEEEISVLQRELEDSTTALDLSEQQLASLQQQMETEVSDLKRQLARSQETSLKLQDEVNLLSPKVQLYERKINECESLTTDLEAKDKQINICRLQLQDMEEERNYSRARIAELDDLFHQNGSAHSVLESKAHQVAQLKAERDTLRQKLNVVTAMATALEEDNKQKNQLVHEIMSRSGDVGGLSTETLIESLQKDLERTLKRCADMSLQLADSQFQIDQLTEQVRRTSKKGNSITISSGSSHGRNNNNAANSEASTKRTYRRSGSYDSPSRTPSRTTTITSMFANSFSAMDESLRGAVTGIGAKAQQLDAKTSLP